MGETLIVNSSISHYRIVSKIGAGGMGDVYLAQDTKLDRKVALKVLPDVFARDSQRMRRFVQEAKAASGLNHPNILTIHEIDHVDAIHFIATEFIDGQTLRQRLKSAPLRLGEALDVTAQIAGALSAAHAAGIVHRDIKPENIMLRGDGIAKVLDFGLAKLTERPPAESVDTEAPTNFKTDPGTVVGTAVYMSPEQARGSQVDARTDVWSLGVVLYEMVAGCLPFAGSTPIELIASILSDKEAPPLARFAREVPAELERIVEKALNKDREQRYQTAKDVLLDLRRLKHKLEVEAEIKRTVPPDLRAATGEAKPPGRQETVSTKQAPVAQTAPVESRSGPESIIAEIRRYKRGGAAILAAITLLSVAGIAYYFYSARSGSRAAIDSIAVLPLVNTSGDPNIDYLSDGISEALINSLTELQQLRVVARSTAFRYKGKEVDPQAVGVELNVRAVLMGRVRQMGDTLNIQLDLVDATTGAQLWGQEYERKVSDLLAVKQAIAQEVTKKLRWRLSGEDERRLVRRDTTNAEAYQLYLRGRFYWNKRTFKDLWKAIEYFNQAVAIDSNYALAYSGLADSYGLLSSYGGATPREAMSKAREAALKALSLDDDLAEAHASLGLILHDYDYNFAGAEREYRRAIELNPNYASAHQFYCELLIELGRFEEGFAEIRRALEIDPLSLIVNRVYGARLFFARRYDESIVQLRKTIELDNGFAPAHSTLSTVYQVKANFAESVKEYAKAQELIGEQQNAQLARASFVNNGWQGFLRAMTGAHRPSNLTSSSLAALYAALGEKDKAFAELNTAYEKREPALVLLNVDSRFDALREDRRFQDLTRHVGLPQ
jgi:eukaryotic-like serine/threonine-protein kinase